MIETSGGNITDATPMASIPPLRYYGFRPDNLPDKERIQKEYARKRRPKPPRTRAKIQFKGEV
jgi:hypothetical protein